MLVPMRVTGCNVRVLELRVFDILAFSSLTRMGMRCSVIDGVGLVRHPVSHIRVWCGLAAAMRRISTNTYNLLGLHT